jgi:hypothetical protein
MNTDDLTEIANILKEIKSKSILVGGGSGEAERARMRDAKIIWELGTKIDHALNNSRVPVERRKEEVRKIVRKLDNQILGKSNDWSSYAYDWFTHFETLEYYLFVVKLAGYREDKDKNRFTKRRVRYLLPIYSKVDDSSLTKAKRDKLTRLLSEDSTLSLSHDDYYAVIRDVRGLNTIYWSEIRSSLDDLSNQVEYAMESDEVDRKQLRESLGATLITQIRYALQLCVMDKKNDFDYAYGTANEVFKRKSDTKSAVFLQLFQNLRPLVKNFDEKNKRIRKSDYYDLEQLNSNLDAITSEDTYLKFMNRKKAIGEVFG